MGTTEQPSMDIEEISEKSGLSRESIYRFTRMGLLPRPSKVGFQKALYNNDHLDRLMKIKEYREESKMPFSEIRDLLHVGKPQDTSRQDYSLAKKEQIMDKALTIFSKNGYSETKISDITDELGVAKGTFYLYFKSKRDLFVECMSRLTTIVLPEEVWDEIKREDDFIERNRIKLKAFLKTFPNFAGVLSLLRLSLQSDDATIAAKARETYRTLEEPVTKDVQKAIADGIAREVDAEVIGVLMLGMAESLGYLVMVDPTCSPDQGASTLLDFVANGILKRTSPEDRSPVWTVKDLKGCNVVLENLRFGDDEHLTAVLGEGQIHVSMENVQSILIRKNGKQYNALLAHNDGEKATVLIDGNLLVSGRSKLGPYSITMSKLSEILSSH